MSECEGCKPGWCERHKVTKSERLAELCGHPLHPSYWEAWEKGYGPGQKASGLGDVVAKAINTVTDGRLKPCGGCGQRREKLNALTPKKTKNPD